MTDFEGTDFVKKSIETIKIWIGDAMKEREEEKRKEKIGEGKIG